MFEVEYLIKDCDDVNKNTLEQEFQDLNIEDWKWDAATGQLIVKGSVSPSKVLRRLENATSKPILIRGASNKESGVSILYEANEDITQIPKVYGLCRFIPTEEKIFLDLIATQLLPNREYTGLVTISGDISRGLKSAGDSLVTLFNANSNEQGKIVLDKEVSGSLPNWIGHCFVLKCVDDSDSATMGIISRSAGLGQNTKQICACTGKSLWTEHAELKSVNEGSSCCSKKDSSPSEKPSCCSQEKKSCCSSKKPSCCSQEKKGCCSTEKTSCCSNGKSTVCA
ncbi:Superoxide dismutase 1 copper chaperone [Schizosaccharomyces pombe]